MHAPSPEASSCPTVWPTKLGTRRGRSKPVAETGPPQSTFTRLSRRENARRAIRQRPPGPRTAPAAYGHKECDLRHISNCSPPLITKHCTPLHVYEQQLPLQLMRSITAHCAHAQPTQAPTGTHPPLFAAKFLSIEPLHPRPVTRGRDQRVCAAMLRTFTQGRRRGARQSEVVLRAAWEGDAEHRHDTAPMSADACCRNGVCHQSTEVKPTWSGRPTRWRSRRRKATLRTSLTGFGERTRPTSGAGTRSTTLRLCSQSCCLQGSLSQWANQKTNSSSDGIELSRRPASASRRS